MGDDGLRVDEAGAWSHWLGRVANKIPNGSSNVSGKNTCAAALTFITHIENAIIDFAERQALTRFAARSTTVHHEKARDVRASSIRRSFAARLNRSPR